METPVSTEENRDDPQRILRELRDARERDARESEQEARTTEKRIRWIKRAMVAMLLATVTLYVARFVF